MVAAHLELSASAPGSTATRLWKPPKRDVPGSQEVGSEVDRDGSNPCAGWARMCRRDHHESLCGLELQAYRFDLTPLRDELIRDSLVDLPGVARIGEKPRKAGPDALGVSPLAIFPLADGKSGTDASGTTFEDFNHRSDLASTRAGAAMPPHGRATDEDPACRDGAPATRAPTSSSVPSIVAPVESPDTDP